MQDRSRNLKTLVSQVHVVDFFCVLPSTACVNATFDVERTSCVTSRACHRLEVVHADSIWPNDQIVITMRMSMIGWPMRNLCSLVVEKNILNSLKQMLLQSNLSPSIVSSRTSLGRNCEVLATRLLMFSRFGC